MTYNLFSGTLNPTQPWLGAEQTNPATSKAGIRQ